MKVCNCENPRSVINPFTHQAVIVGCGKCDACLAAKRAHWIKRLQKESYCWRYVFMIYLDYNEEMLPRFDFCRDTNEYLCEQATRFYENFTFDEVFLKTEDIFNFLKDYDKKETQYVFDRLNGHHTGIPHPSVRDIQNFKKRLNSYISREITGKYGCFRSAIASEIGPSTFRPHYHGILFFNDERIAAKLPDLLRRAWTDGSGRSLGHTDCSLDEGGSANYISKYITKDYRIPAIYLHPSFSTKFLTSRRPPLGSLFESKLEIQRIFFDSSPTTVEFEKIAEGSFVPKSVPISKNVKDRLFPKCPLYDQISVDGRTELYKSVISNRGLIGSYDDFVGHLICRCYNFDFDEESYDFWNKYDFKKLKVPSLDPKNQVLALLIEKITSHFTCFDGLKRLYYAGSRVWYQSEIFGVSFDFYLQRIYDFYDRNLPRYVLGEFYRLQSRLVMQYKDFDWRCLYPLTFSDVDVTDNPETLSYLKELSLRKLNDFRTHVKNDYLEKLRVTDPILSNLIYFYYA